MTGGGTVTLAQQDIENGRIRSGRREGFTVLYNSMVTDERISLKAKGLFAVMMSRPEGWEFSVSGLAAFTGAGKDTIRSALSELEAVGYLIRGQSHRADGTFGGNVYILQDIAPPLSENPDDGETRHREKPLSENPTQSNKDLNQDNTPYSPPEGAAPEEKAQPKRRRRGEAKAAPDWKPERFAGFWDYYPRGESKQAAIRAWDKLRPSDDLIDEIAQALQQQKATEAWRQGIGIPYASTWLNNRRWEDRVQPSYSASPPESGGERVYGWQ